MKLAIATRSSALALWQAERTRTLLAAALPDAQVEVHAVQSAGDRFAAVELNRFAQPGIFTAEVDRALVDREADVGVHSLKDVPTKLPDGVALVAVLARGPIEDALVTRDGATLDALPSGARVATGSVRRAAMLRRIRADLELVAIRGNVPTRLEKLDAGEADALLLARAGLERLKLAARISEVLPLDRFLPAPGQGLIALTCRTGDTATARTLAAIGDPEGWSEALAERAVLATLRGGCNAPLGAHARAVEGAVFLTARVLSRDGRESLEESALGRASEPEELGERVARALIVRGAARLIDAARS